MGDLGGVSKLVVGIIVWMDGTCIDFGVYTGNGWMDTGGAL